MSEKVKKARYEAREKYGDNIALRAVERVKEAARRRGERIVGRANRDKGAARVGIKPLGDEVYLSGGNWDDLGTGARPSWRDPHALSEILAAFVADSGWKEKVGVGELEARWEDIVGSQTAKHCVIQSYKDGKLILNTSSSSWQAQITALSAVLKEKINKEIGEGIVTDIVVYTSRK